MLPLSATLQKEASPKHMRDDKDEKNTRRMPPSATRHRAKKGTPNVTLKIVYRFGNRGPPNVPRIVLCNVFILRTTAQRH